jgi:hypothetical protein
MLREHDLGRQGAGVSAYQEDLREDEVPHQESRYQNRSDQCQQCGVFERHGRSMNGAGVIRKRTFRFT